MAHPLLYVIFIQQQESGLGRKTETKKQLVKITIKETIMKKQIIIIAALVFTIAGLSGTAFSWGHGQENGKRSCGAGFNSPMCARGAMANLTESQKTQLQDLHQKFIDDTASTRIAMHAKQEELRILMQTSAPEKAKLIQVANELGDLKKAMMEKRINLALDAKKIAPEVNFPLDHKGFEKRCGMGKSMGKGMSNGMGKNMGCPRINAQQDDQTPDTTKE